MFTFVEYHIGAASINDSTLFLIIYILYYTYTLLALYLHAVMARNISQPPVFSAQGDPTSLGTRWKKWRKGFDLYLVAAAITVSNQKYALLLHCGGEDLQEIYDTLTPSANEPDVYKAATGALDNYFQPKQNKRYERHIFITCQQNEGETITQYVTRLRTFSKTCQFHDATDEIVDQVIEKCNSNKLRKRLLKEKDLNLDTLLEIAYIIESTDHQSKQYKKSMSQELLSDDDDNAINKISHHRHKKLPIKYKKSPIGLPFQISPGNRAQPLQSQTCYRCGSKTHLANKCEVTKGKSCNACGKPGHFSNVCKSRPLSRSTIQYLVAESSSDDEFVFAISSHNQMKHSNMFPITINGQSIHVLIDSGSTVNVISESLLKSMSPRPSIKPYHKKVYGFNTDQPLDIIGSFYAEVKVDSMTTTAEFLVLPTASTTILCSNTAIMLNLLRIGPPPPSECFVNHIDSGSPIDHQSSIDALLHKYADCFHGLGELSDVQINIHTNPNIHPYAQKARRLPILMQKQVDSELDKLLQLAVIEPISEPPTWISPLVIVPKKDCKSVRICVDMRAVNTSIIQEPYQIPTLEEILHIFNGCTKFTKLDLNKGYHQISLTPESRNLTAFACHRAYSDIPG